MALFIDRICKQGDRDDHQNNGRYSSTDYDRCPWCGSKAWYANGEADPVDPVGSRDIAERIGVKAQTVAQWKLRGIMPEPRWQISGLPVWRWCDIEKWAQDTGRMYAGDEGDPGTGWKD